MKLLVAFILSVMIMVICPPPSSSDPSTPSVTDGSTASSHKSKVSIKGDAYEEPEAIQSASLSDLIIIDQTWDHLHTVPDKGYFSIFFGAKKGPDMDKYNAAKGRVWMNLHSIGKKYPLPPPYADYIDKIMTIDGESNRRIVFDKRVGADNSIPGYPPFYNVKHGNMMTLSSNPPAK